MYERIPLISLREYDFTDLAASGDMDVLAVKAFDASRFRQGTVEVRIHAKTIANGTIAVRVSPVSFSHEQPQTDFVDTATAATELSFGSSDTPPYLLASDVAFVGGSDYLRLVVRGTQGSSVGNLRATISVDFVGKTL